MIDIITSRKANERWLKEIFKAIKAQDIGLLAELVAKADADMLDALREAKLLRHVPAEMRDAVVSVIREAARRCSTAKLEELDKYLVFLNTIEKSLDALQKEIQVEIAKLPRCGKVDLLAWGSEVFGLYLDGLKKGVAKKSAGSTVAEHELHLHDSNGALVDLINASVRAINECSKLKLTNEPVLHGKERRSKAIGMMVDVVRLAGEMNSLEWLFDSVSYSEFAIDEYIDQPVPVFVFKFSDPRLKLMRTLSIRRSLIHHFNPRRNARFMRELLSKLARPILLEASRYYRRALGLTTHNSIDSAYFEKVSRRLLQQIDAEDDLLVAASKGSPEIVAHYAAAIGLRWCSSAAEATRALVPPSRARNLTIPRIPIAILASNIDDGANGELVKSAIQNLTSELPARNYLSLFDLPFIKDGNHVLPLLGGHSGTWTVSVREALIKGGELSKDVGAIWEDFCADIFKDTDWTVIGRGVKLKQGKKYLTDVDLLLMRGDLLLVVQIKALIGSGHTLHDHWKNRKTIELGCLQAAAATSLLVSDRDLLVSVCGGKRKAESINKIQPVVLTNVDLFNGWEYSGVPVIGESTRKAICFGAKVEYYEPASGNVRHTHVFTKQEDLTTDKIIDMLGRPVDLDISAEGASIGHDTHLLRGLEFRVPAYSVREDLGSVAAIEPRLP